MDFVVLKVNGKDVSTASHEDTIAAFTTAQEPIIVEVLKRPQRNDPTSLEPVSLLCDASTQTVGNGWEPQYQSPTSSFAQPLESCYSPSEHHYSTIPGDVEGGEEDDGCEVEYEEVVLHRHPEDSKLGLTLCYGAPDDSDTDIYISEVDPESLAARDGRIQEGDQLLQINGVDVRSRDQAVSLFSEGRADFTLLLARPHLPEQEEEEEEVTTDTGTNENAPHEKDSGVGRTDESTKNDESSEQEATDIYSGPEGIKRPNLSPKAHDGSLKDNEFSGDDIMFKQEFRNQLPLKGITLAPLCQFQSDASLDREMALLNKEMENIQLECETLVHRHLESQQKSAQTTDTNRYQLEHVYVNLSDLNTTRNGYENLPLTKKQTVERWVNSLFLPRKYTTTQDRDRDSSSAYNTADSSGSGPLRMELTTLSACYDNMYGSVMSLVSPKMEDKGTQLRDSDVTSIFSCDSCRRCCKALVEKESISCIMPSTTKNPITNNNSAEIPSKNTTPFQNFPLMTDRESSFERRREERNKNCVTFFPSPNTMYTNEANLQHTIWLQQQMLRQSMTHQNMPRNASSCPTTPSSPGYRSFPPSVKWVAAPKPQSASGFSLPSGGQPTLSTVKEEEESKLEWKVKRRPDGTRYITRRPVRSRLLKARALKILEERTGLTTDEDAASELKTGRYWSKEERKRHLEKARDRKRKEMILRSKLRDEGDEGRKELSILELSHKKLLKRRGRVLFDDFTTIQELLAHGTKVANSGTLGLLTVTTV